MTATGDDWRHAAACRSEDPEAWFPIGIAGPALLQAEQAKTVCLGCPVIDACRRWALTTPEEEGVWGGLSELELRRHRAGAPIRACVRCQMPIVAPPAQLQCHTCAQKGGPPRAAPSPKKRQAPYQPAAPAPGRVDDHHDWIAQLRDAGHTWRQIAITLSLSESAIKTYWAHRRPEVKEAYKQRRRAARRARAQQAAR